MTQATVMSQRKTCWPPDPCRHHDTEKTCWHTTHVVIITHIAVLRQKTCWVWSHTAQARCLPAFTSRRWRHQESPKPFLSQHPIPTFQVPFMPLVSRTHLQLPSYSDFSRIPLSSSAPKASTVGHISAHVIPQDTPHILTVRSIFHAVSFTPYKDSTLQTVWKSCPIPGYFDSFTKTLSTVKKNIGEGKPTSERHQGKLISSLLASSLW